jgi:hypothetical protein
MNDLTTAKDEITASAREQGHTPGRFKRSAMRYTVYCKQCRAWAHITMLDASNVRSVERSTAFTALCENPQKGTT